MRIQEGGSERFRALFTCGAHRIAQLTLRAGEELPEHRAPHHLFLCVWSGELEWTVGEERVRLKRGDCTSLAPGLSHAVRALEDSAALLVLFADDSDVDKR
ncbi:cupin domain-containing protein [Alicyclobacillus mali]|uniref:Cupin domain-containing protein n=1 Tax=Alicyclobacillus mali (ex Roth et al. 2021) TaxID=1123961 RepID=A0ABS0F746_9BACL|nr:cupin domain-containing protein [Alicyclobacillus mali (ex Roth et al. 2021)]MBF8379117.1 cupin domain-containing protein [Alicyclobacillus mali (ex Roth et al. 2021)]MCL6489576.1 cupin domain-containing protein [Alicyclobacillus mali (ex Roth et al. 2021)]